MLSHALTLATTRFASGLLRLRQFEIVEASLTHIPTALAVLDESSRLVFNNPAFEQLFPNVASSGSQLVSLLPEALCLDLGDVLQGAPTRSREALVEGHLVHAHVFSLSSPSHSGLRVGLAFTDTEEKEGLIRQLIRSEKLAGIGLLASGMAHQLNKNFYGIIGLGEVVLEEDHLPTIQAHVQKLIG